MALDRNIFWVGRQWAVTGSGVQAVDQLRKGQFDIEVARLWDAGLSDRLRVHDWFNIDDFEKALTIARARYPAPPGVTLPLEARAPNPVPRPVPRPVPSPILSASINPPQPAVKVLTWRIERASARFLQQWRVRRS